MSLLRPRRSGAVVGLLGLALVLILTTRPVWVSASAQRPGATSNVDLLGAQASTAVPALAIVVGACAVALTLAGRRLRGVVLGLAALACLGASVSAGWVLIEPRAAVASELAGSTGVTAESVVLQGVSVSPWPWVCGLVGLAGLVWAGVCWARAGHWDDGHRHEQAVPAVDSDHDPAATWDALSRGDDPTGSQ